MLTNPSFSLFPNAPRKALTGALLLVLAAAIPMRGGDLLRGGAPAQVPGAVPVYGATPATTAQARANANDTLARATQAQQSLKAMQAAARNLAVNGANNLGADPNHTGLQLPNVPNGLAPGGLAPDSGFTAGVVNPVTTWTGAGTPVQTTNGAQTNVKITQTAQQAILNWQTFNIGKNTTLNIDQSAGGTSASQWIAFNIIRDSSAVPSQILGSIQAIGQVYVINQNGIIFGGSSQVNAHALVASSLPINTNLVKLGLLNNPDQQFLFSQLPIGVGSNGTPAFTPPASFLAGGRDGDVTVQAGATLTSPSNSSNVGGRIALIGYNVSNAGTISTPDGQAILAAGRQVAFAAHTSIDPTLRGLDVFVGAVDQSSGIATNSGLIEAPGANVTMTGQAINQLGVIDSLTTVSLNGRIDLLADYNAVPNPSFNSVTNPTVPFYLFQSSGNVTLGPGSVTDVLPDLSSSARVVGSQLALPSLVNIRGESVHLQTNSLLLAPGAALPAGNGVVIPLSNIGVSASVAGGIISGITLNAGSWSFTGGFNPQSTFGFTGGQIYLDQGAEINAAGSTDVSASVSENIVSAQLRGSELADSSLQRNGVLRGQTVNIDILQTGVFNGQTWVGSPIANLSGYANLVDHTVGELTTSGGSVTLNAGDSVVMQAGSGINVSGGWINYQGAMVQTTKVVSNGHIFDISQATPNLVYQGILNGFTADYSKWGITESFGTPLLGGPYFQAGYLQGGNGGSINIQSPAMALDGNLTGNTYAGARQRTVAPTVSSLSLNFQGQEVEQGVFLPVLPSDLSIIFEEGSNLPAVDPFALNGGIPVTISTARKQEVDLSPDLFTADGFGALVINSDGNITVPASVALTPGVDGSITLTAANIDIEGKIIAPSGNLSFTVNDFSPTALTALITIANSKAPLPPDFTRGNFTLGASASLSTAGLVVDDLYGSSAPYSLPLVSNENGGSITIDTFSANLAAGSSIDVSGGAAVSSAGKVSYGSGGSIKIEAGQNPNVPSTLGGKLVLNSTLSGYSGGKGGSLTVQMLLIQVGGATSNPDTLLLPSGFFSQGGFDSFTLNGVGESVGGDPFQDIPGVLITPGTVLAPVARSWVAIPNATGVVLTTVQLPTGVRAPVSLSFNAVGLLDFFTHDLRVRGDVVMGAGSSIQLDPGGSVAMNGDTVTVMGSVFAPGGAITISGGKDSTSIFQDKSQALATVDIGPDSVLSVAGAVVLAPDPTGHGYTTGSVLNGGKIAISGNIVAEAGSVLNVSGASGVLDMPASYSQADVSVNNSVNSNAYVPTLINSNGGSITLAGGQELFTAATLIGNSGGPAAQGGSLSISSGRFYDLNTPVSAETPLDVTLTLTQNGAPFHFNGSTAIGNAIMDAGNNPIDGHAWFAADDFNNHGFDSLSLQGAVQFSGPVSVVAKGSVAIASNPKFGNAVVILADPSVANSSLTITAPYVDLGTFQAPFNGNNSIVTDVPFKRGDNFIMSVAPTYGTGSLVVNATQLIDIGDVSLQNIGAAGFNVAGGDLRGDGTLDVQGGITIAAGQVYPPTAVAFNIFAYDHGGTPGSVTITGGSKRQLPLSAGGALNIYASTINQGGVLRAPIGVINLGWDGTTGAAPTDQLAGNTIAVTPTLQLNLTDQSITSVSAVDPLTGQNMIIPYGINLNGNSWIAPNGVNITIAGNSASGGGVPSKSINISGENVAIDSGASIDIRGGGDLFAYRFVSGTGGNVDILASTSSFAVIPGYQAGYAPYAPYTSVPDPGSSSNLLGGDAGYVNSSLKVGGRIYLAGGDGLAAGFYTLLPARYALLPGAFLVTPESGVPVGSVSQPDGSAIVSGYAFNSLNPAQTGQPLFSNFEVDSQAVVLSRAEYDASHANSFFVQSAKSNNIAVPRLPMDSGQVVLLATQTMSVNGSVDSGAPAGGRGGLVDISSPADILIAGASTDTSGFSGLVLDSSGLSAFGAESLLIGGVRESGNGGTTVVVTTNNITVDNSGSPLTGPEVILVANKNLTLAPGAEVTQSGASTGLDSVLLIGNSTPGGADGVLLRVSSNPLAQLSRAGVDSSTAPGLTVGAGAQISGVSVTLDSTSRTSFDPTAVLTGQIVNLDSGQISLQLNNPGALQPTSGLVLPESELQTLQTTAQSLSLLSYSSIDIYGTGQIGTASFASLALHFSEIRGFNNGGGTVGFAAQNILLDNSTAGAFRAVAAPQQGTLEFDAGVIRIGVNQMNVDQYAAQLAAQPGSQPSSNLFNLNQYIDQYSQVNMDAAGGILMQQTSTKPQNQALQGAVVTGVLNTQGNLTLSAPLITGETGANQAVIATGALNTVSQASPVTVAGGLGASVNLQGASVTADSSIVLNSGELTLHATTGSVLVGTAGNLDAGGISQTYFDVTKYTGGGRMDLVSDGGNVSVAAGGMVSVASQPGGGNAGALSISAPAGSFILDSQAVLKGAGGAQQGTFSLDVASIPGGSLGTLASALSTAGFTGSVSIRDRNDALITVDGVTTAHTFNLSADNGSILVTGKIDASGVTGGVINLQAAGNVTLQSGAQLTVVGSYYDDAGKGGAITIEAGGETNGSSPVAVENPNGTFSGNGIVDLQSGAELDLQVLHQLTTTDLAQGNATDIRTDLFAGTLHLRAPQTSDSLDLQINPVNSTINGASAIIVEGYQIFNATDGSIDNQEGNVFSNGQTFAGNTATITARLVGANPYGKAFVVEPGAEIINTTGDLTLSSDWNLSTFRFGPDGVAGDLTLRAAGNLVFNASLSDGFKSADHAAQLMNLNALLPANVQSWSYRLTAGADLSAVDFRQVQPLELLGPGSGSLTLGLFAPNETANPGDDADLASAIAGFYQVIRTGAGDIEISTGNDVQLRNQFAGIYTVGSKAATMANFDVPKLFKGSNTAGGSLYPAQYSLGGGNVTIAAQGNIEHLTEVNGSIVDDSVSELPTNWLYRRGYVDSTGNFGTTLHNDVASTTWWVDFSNFFEGVGALGGGNVTLTAGNDIRNVDAVIPTNARMPGYNGSASHPIPPNAANLLELGGGDLVVQAGNNVNGGVYYVERGQAVINAGNSILTNSTRAPFPTAFFPTQPGTFPGSSWLPTTLFLGEGSFSLDSRYDLLMGPVVNPFLLPAGAGNTVWNKSYFSTYAPGDTVAVSSLTGDVTLREDITPPTNGNQAPEPILEAWMQNVSFYDGQPTETSYYQPWIRLDETDITPFATEFSLMPSSLLATSFSGDINLVGGLTLSPSPNGTVDLDAAGSVNALQVVGGVSGLSLWGTATINLSDANPAAIPGMATPFAYENLVGRSKTAPLSTQQNFLAFIGSLFNETGATSGAASVLQAKQELHTQGLLHAGDSQPVHIYALNGSISGLTLFSPKVTDVIAGQDITDIALYIQNDSASDVSVVSAGRDIIAYDPVSPLRELASNFAVGNQLVVSSQNPLAGDIQISGPGTLEVLAGRNLTLGAGLENADGTALGITSIGNARDPYLPFGGASVIAGAGVGGSSLGLDSSKIDFSSFIAQFIEDPVNGPLYLSELAATEPGSQPLTPQTFSLLSAEEQDRIALDVFYLVLRDAGRDHNKPSSPGFRNYNAGIQAVAALFPGSSWQGNIDLTAREIKTTSGGDISLFAPGGQVTLGDFPVTQIVEIVNSVTKKTQLVIVPGNSATDMGIVTQGGGNIGIFTHGNVDIGTQRIFTLQGGNEIIWSSDGNIAAGASSKTVQSAPPTRVLVDPQSADVQTDLSGLATGGGIGVLATVAGAAPGDVDLIAPLGTVDAGDAGIRVSGNLNISATVVLNASNIQVGGASAGTPVAPAAPNIGGITTNSNASVASTGGGPDVAKKEAEQAAQQQEEKDSEISVEVLGYGGGDGGEQSQNDDVRKKTPEARQKAAEDARISPSRGQVPLAMNLVESAARLK